MAQRCLAALSVFVAGKERQLAYWVTRLGQMIEMLLEE